MSKGTPNMTVIPVLFDDDGKPLINTFLVLKCAHTKAVKPLQLITDKALAYFFKQHTTTILPTEASGGNDK